MSLAKDKPYYADPSDYEDDVYSWAFEQAQLLRLGRFREVDLPNVIEEIESLGREIRIQLVVAYADLISGLLTWEKAPQLRTIETSRKIRDARFVIQQEEAESRSLERNAKGLVAEVYPQAVRSAAALAGLERSDFQTECPYDLGFLRNVDALPGEAH